MVALRHVLLPVLVIGLVALSGSVGAISASQAADSIPSQGSDRLVAQETTNESSNLTVDGVARTSAPGIAGTQYYTVEVPNASDGATLHSLELNYSGTGTDLTEGLSHYRAEIRRNPDSENRTEIRLANASVSATNTTVTYSFPDGHTLHAGDEIWVAISGVENPTTSGTIGVGVQLNPDRDGPRGVTTLDIGVPAPTISPQGLIGESTRIGVHDPEGANGFIVAYGPDGSVIGTHALDPDRDLQMDIGIWYFVEDEHEENGMVVRLVAHIDSNGDGDFDPTVDEPFTREGNPVSATVEHAVFHGGTTTTTPPSTTSEAPITRTEDGGNTTTSSASSTTPSTTTTSVPGFHVGTVLLALLGGALLARRG